MKTAYGIGVVAVLVLIGLIVVSTTCAYIVDEREQVVVTRLNRPIRVIVGALPEAEFATLQQEIVDTARRKKSVDTETSDDLRVDRGAGLYFKAPFVDAVSRFPDTVLEYDAEPEDIVTADKKKLVVDNFARWRIENPLLYWISVRTQVAAHGVLDDIIYSVVREELGRNDLIEVIRTSNRPIEEKAEVLPEGGEAEGVVSSEDPMRDQIKNGREAIMKAVSARADETARREYGIRVLDVRIKRAELLPENLQAVFARMEAERSRISKGYRSDGRKQADIIEGDTDRRVQVIGANAERDATMLKGDGDAGAVKIFAEAFNSNPELYRFMRSLEVLNENTPEGAEMVIGVDSGVFRLLKGAE
ncbi:MAG: protease modulator HflC [Candidatus Hydrogenedentes bacterium]|nr:protease modulator HflC [Candidatus Hydrogenedentota bacterium]